jgi:hypothetical protein
MMMSVLHAADVVTVWTEQHKPVRMVWRGTRYRVTDTPTPLRGEAVLHDALTHPLSPFVGWRFQASDESDPARVVIVDVARRAGGRWELLAAYE